MYKFVCDPDALFQMALAENHRNALKMEAAAVTANSNNANLQVGNTPSNSFSTNSASQHNALLQHHQQQNHSHHTRLSSHHPSIESPHNMIDDELGTFNN